MFTTRTVASYRHDYYGSMIFDAAVRRAGLPSGTTTHDLRHHYASVLLEAGSPSSRSASAWGTRTRRSS